MIQITSRRKNAEGIWSGYLFFCLQRFAFQGKLSTFALLNGKWNTVSFLSMAPVS